METTSRVGAQAPAAEGGQQLPSARRTVDGYLLAPFPWYGLDEAFTGPRWLMQVGMAADGAVEHGSIGHGEEPSVRGESTEDKERFAHRTAEKLLKLGHEQGEIGIGSSAAGDAWYRWSSRAKSKIGRTLISALVK